MFGFTALALLILIAFAHVPSRWSAMRHKQGLDAANAIAVFEAELIVHRAYVIGPSFIDERS